MQRVYKKYQTVKITVVDIFLSSHFVKENYGMISTIYCNNSKTCMKCENTNWY